MANKIINVVVPETLWKAVKAAAKDSDCSAAAIVRNAVRLYIERRK